MCRIGVAALARATLLAPAAARAGDAWSDPFPGVRHLHRSTGEPWQIHALVVDLCAPGISLRATRSGERRRVASSFANLVGAQAAINGDSVVLVGQYRKPTPSVGPQSSRSS
jgi:hypothetical protein